MLIKVQESFPKAYKKGKTSELLRTKAGPWAPPMMPGALLHTRFGSLQQYQLFWERHSFKNDGQLKNSSLGPMYNSALCYATLQTLTLNRTAKSPWCSLTYIGASNFKAFFSLKYLRCPSAHALK